MPRKRFEYLKDLTSDVAVKAYGSTFKELLENAAQGLLEVICKTKKVKKERCIKAIINGKDQKDLLYAFLQEIIVRVDTECMFFSHIEVISASDTNIEMVLHGEDVSPELGNTVVKAVTNHKFTLEKRTLKNKKESYIATFTVDI